MLKLVEKNEHSHTFKDFEVIYAIKKLIEYNPTYDAHYLWEVANSTMGPFLWDDYGFAFVRGCFILNRLIRERTDAILLCVVSNISRSEMEEE